jgi:hypothetical protein
VKRLVWAVTAVLLLGLGTLVPTRANAEDDISSGWEIRAGFFVPEKSSSRSINGDVWLALGAEHRFWNAEKNSLSLGVEYYGGTHLYSVPILVTLNHDLGRYRAGAGIGVAMNHASSKTTNSFGYKISAGVDLRENETQSPLFFDLAYRGTTQTHNELNGFEFSLAYTF